MTYQTKLQTLEAAKALLEESWPDICISGAIQFSCDERVAPLAMDAVRFAVVKRHGPMSITTFEHKAQLGHVLAVMDAAITASQESRPPPGIKIKHPAPPQPEAPKMREGLTDEGIAAFKAKAPKPPKPEKRAKPNISANKTPDIFHPNPTPIPAQEPTREKTSFVNRSPNSEYKPEPLAREPARDPKKGHAITVMLCQGNGLFKCPVCTQKWQTPNRKPLALCLTVICFGHATNVLGGVARIQEGRKSA